MRAFVVYTVARLALFLASGAVLYLLGARGLLLVGLAAVVGALLSWVLLRGPRDAVARSIVEARRRRGASGAAASTRAGGPFRALSRRLDEGARSEDQD